MKCYIFTPILFRYVLLNTRTALIIMTSDAKSAAPPSLSPSLPASLITASTRGLFCPTVSDRTGKIALINQFFFRAEETKAVFFFQLEFCTISTFSGTFIVFCFRKHCLDFQTQSVCEKSFIFSTFCDYISVYVAVETQV